MGEGTKRKKDRTEREKIGKREREREWEREKREWIERDKRGDNKEKYRKKIDRNKLVHLF